MYNINNSKYVELVTLERNKLHAMPTREANSIIQWWNSCGFDDLLVTQLNSREIHFSISATIYEPDFSASRRKLQVQEYLNVRVRKDVKQIANFKEHVEEVKKGVGVSIRLLPSMFPMGNVITKNVKHLLKPNKSIPHFYYRPIFEHGRIIRFYLNKVRNDHNSKTMK
ncbi:hypothetical protein KSP40_PGU006973 [Platanthera guangdongensis]|uniref:Uncharacterized protein n=1 Tax=Platanthera guangdongensis TaxID=2320717 RepID=A0ABR2MH18_9ASPA